MKKGLVIGLVATTSAFIVGGITVGALYNSFIFDNSQPISTPEPKAERSLDEKVIATQMVAIPEDFPNDFPIYPEADLTDSWSAKGVTSSAISVIWETQDEQEVVTDFYRESLLDQEWEIKSDLVSTASAAISFAKDDLEGFVGVVTGASSTTISVTIGQ